MADAPSNSPSWPLGMRDIATMLGVQLNTVYQWRKRKGPDGSCLMPDPDGTVNNDRVWERATILRWAGDTGRLSADTSPELVAEFVAAFGEQPAPAARRGALAGAERP